MYQITRIAEEKGLTPEGTADRIQQVLKTYGLPFECGLTLGTLTEAIALDKKNLNGNLNVILLHEIGDSYIELQTFNSLLKQQGLYKYNCGGYISWVN